MCLLDLQAGVRQFRGSVVLGRGRPYHSRSTLAQPLRQKCRRCPRMATALSVACAGCAASQAVCVVKAICSFISLLQVHGSGMFAGPRSYACSQVASSFGLGGLGMRNAWKQPSLLTYMCFYLTLCLLLHTAYLAGCLYMSTRACAQPSARVPCPVCITWPP